MTTAKYEVGFFEGGEGGGGYNMKTVIWWNDKNLVRVSLLGGIFLGGGRE